MPTPTRRTTWADACVHALTATPLFACSLLMALGGRSTARLDGSIKFNDKKMNKGIKRKIGFVSQDDLLFGQLTTYEVGVDTSVEERDGGGRAPSLRCAVGEA